MTKPLSVGLPVMLHYEAEIQAFLKGKERIESLGDELGFPISVGAFLFFMPKALKEENRSKQLENQAKYHLPIIHCQTPIMDENSLTFGGDESVRFPNKPGLLEIAIEQCARLRESNSTYPVHIDIHVGAAVLRTTGQPNPNPGVYSLDYFLEHRKELFEHAKTRFQLLDNHARKHGFEMVLENAYPAVIEADHAYEASKPKFLYLPFNQFNELMEISRGKLTLDVSHWGAGQNLPSRFQAPDSEKETREVLSLEEVQSWNEYSQKHPSFESYLPHTKAVHISNTTGIGCRLEKYPELEKRWGNTGGVEGGVSRGELKEIMIYARDRNIPVMVEVDYDIKNIPTNQFKEADKLLNYVLRD